MRTVKQIKLLKIKSKTLSDLFNEKYGHKLGELNNTTGIERVKETFKYSFVVPFALLQ